MARKDPEHVKKIRDSGFNRRPAKTSVYRANCDSGYVFTSAKRRSKGFSHFHHILPIQTLGSSYLSPTDKKDFFHNCMAMTKWDINSSHNLIGLPTKKVYHAYETSDDDSLVDKLSGQAAGPRVSAHRLLPAQEGIAGVIPDLPCHQNHHDIYNIHVIRYLQRQVWEPLVEEQPKCKLSGKDIRTKLEKASDHWRKFLKRRGEDKRGANHCWVNRNKRGYPAFWYIPFSMHPGRPPAAPPPPEYPKGKKKKWLQSLFK